MSKRTKAPAKKAKRKGTPRTPPFAPYPEWTTSRFYSFLRSALRSAYNKWPPKWEVLKQAQRPYEGTDKRTKWEYKCSECGGWFKGSEVSVDHKEPAGALNKLEDIPGFVDRLFCSVDGLQVLHKECHDKKTAQERQAVKAAKEME